MLSGPMGAGILAGGGIPPGVGLHLLTPQTGQYYDLTYSTSLGAGTDGVILANRLYGMPILFEHVVTIDRLGIEVTLGAALQNARVGIYRDDGGLPGALVLDAGTFSVADVTFAEVTGLSQELAPDWYWLAIVSSGTPTMVMYQNGRGQAQLGYSSGTTEDRENMAFVAHAYGALPDPFGGAILSGKPLALRARIG